MSQFGLDPFEDRVERIERYERSVHGLTREMLAAARRDDVAGFCKMSRARTQYLQWIEEDFEWLREFMGEASSDAA